MLPKEFVFFGAAVASLGGLVYLIDTFKGKVQPNKVTWLLWAVAPLVAFSAQVSQGVGIESLTTFITGCIPATIFTASFLHKDSWRITRFDVACGLLSLVGLLLWLATRHGNYAILFAMLADFLAAIPTVRKSYDAPDSENDALFWCGVVNAGVGLLVLTHWDFKHYAFTLYLLVMSVSLALLIRLKPKKYVSANFRRLSH